MTVNYHGIAKSDGIEPIGMKNEKLRKRFSIIVAVCVNWRGRHDWGPGRSTCGGMAWQGQGYGPVEWVAAAGNCNDERRCENYRNTRKRDDENLKKFIFFSRKIGNIFTSQFFSSTFLFLTFFFTFLFHKIIFHGNFGISTNILATKIFFNENILSRKCHKNIVTKIFGHKNILSQK